MKNIFIILLCVCSQVLYAADFKRVEYFIDTDPGMGSATPAPLPVAGIAEFAADLTAVSGGLHVLYIRVQDAAGYWSHTMHRPFLKVNLAQTDLPPAVTKAEYFIDTDPGFGKATAAGSAVNGGFDITVDLADVIGGLHVLYIRTQDAAGNWSHTMSRPFIKTNVSAGVLPKVVATEYFIDADPGYGLATQVPVSNPSADAEIEILADLNGLAIGSHTLYVRAKDANGAWSMVQTTEFCYGAMAQFTLSDTVVCHEGFITFTNTTLGASTGTTYAWDYNGDNTIDYSGKNNANRLFSKPGTYTATLTVTEAGGVCPNTFSKKIVIMNPTVEVSAKAPKELYIGQSLAVVATVDLVSDKHTVKWTATGGTIDDATSKNISFSADAPGDYTLTATVTDVLDCAGQQTYAVKVLPLVENFIVRDSISAYRSKQNRIATQYLTPENSVEWYSVDPAIATVNANGLVTCVSNGGTYIWGRVDGVYTDSVWVEVKDYIALDSIRVVQNAGVAVGTAMNTTVYFYPENASIRSVKWYSSDTTIAKVNALDPSTAEIMPLKAGTCNIIVIAEDGNIPAVTFVTATGAYVDVQKVIVPETVYAKVGEQVAIQAVLEPYYASADIVEWSTDDASIAAISQRSSVSKPGLVTAVSAGTTYIYSNANEGTGGFTKIIVSNSAVPEIKTPTTISFYQEAADWQFDLSQYIDDDNGLAKLTVTASKAENVTLSINAATKMMSVALVDPLWTGSEIITITATDADGLKTSKQIEIVVSGTPNQAPQLYFPAIVQTAASAVQLNVAEYVTDDRDAVQVLTMTAKSSGTSTASITLGVLHIEPQSASWTGSDTITITATDTKGRETVQTITYTVKAQQVATPPAVQSIPVQYSNSFGEFADVFLNRYVKDAATMPEQMSWETSASFKLDVRIKNNVLTATPVDINWIGSERVTIIATNSAGLRDTSEIIFIKQNTQEVKWEGSPDINFFAERTIANRGAAITLYPDMTGARSWRWIITGEGDTIVSQALYPNITFKKNGVYDVALICQNKTDIDTATARNYISIFGITPGDTTICLGGSVKLKIATAGLDTWKWSTGETDNIITVAPTKTTTYKIRVTKDLFEYEDSVKVSISGKVNLGADFAVCEKSTKELVPALPASYRELYWNGSTQAAASFAADKKGEITVRAIDTLGCESKDTVVLTALLPLPLTGLPATEHLCPDATKLLTAQNGTDYQWKTDFDTQLWNESSITVSEAGGYIVTVKGENGCSVNDTVAVVAVAPPVISISPAAAVVCPSSSVKLTATGAEQYVWDGGITNGIAFTPAASKMYSVTGADAHGCTATATAQVDIRATYAQQIGAATLAQDGSAIVVAWNPVKNQKISHVELQKFNDSSTKFETLKSFGEADSTYYVDKDADGNLKSYSYRLISYDSVCPAAPATSAIHATIHLSRDQSVDANTVGLKWNAYKGLDVTKYFIYAIRDGKHTDTLEEGVVDAQKQFYTVSYPRHVNGNKYQIAFDLPEKLYVSKLKNDSGPFSQSMSNLSEAIILSDISTAAEHVGLYPVPANEYVEVKSASVPMSCTVLSVKGESVLTVKGTSRIDVSQLAAGDYVLRIEFGNTTVTKSFVKQ